MIRSTPLSETKYEVARPLRNTACVAILGIATLLSGCVTTPDIEALRESPSFQVGFGDGCAMSSEDDKSFSSTKSRDAYAFENDPAYRAGWRQGYLECKSRVPDQNNGGRILGERDNY